MRIYGAILLSIVLANCLSAKVLKKNVRSMRKDMEFRHNGQGNTIDTHRENIEQARSPLDDNELSTSVIKAREEAKREAETKKKAKEWVKAKLQSLPQEQDRIRKINEEKQNDNKEHPVNRELFGNRSNSSRNGTHYEQKGHGDEKGGSNESVGRAATTGSSDKTNTEQTQNGSAHISAAPAHDNKNGVRKNQSRYPFQYSCETNGPGKAPTMSGSYVEDFSANGKQATFEKRKTNSSYNETPFF